MSRLIVVSNRVALPKEARAGGLASAMQAALAERGGLWFGWSGRLVEEGERTLDRRSEGRVDYALLDLTRAEYQEYYLGFANRTLWPLLHFRQALLDFSRKDFAGYLRVNRLFAEHIAGLLRPGDRIWVHDYHLIPLGAELRRLGVEASLGFFLHVPLPPRDLLAALPHHELVFSALAAYDLVGLQTPTDLNALLGYFRDECAAVADEGGNVRLPDGRRFRAGVFPIGIDTERVARQAERAVGSAANKRLVTSLEHRRLAIGVDRLDYSKGLPQRFEAFGRFLSQHPEWRSKLSLLQIAPPSREDVPEYRELRSRLERLAGATNGRYAEPDWVPIRYVNRSFQQETLTGFYRSAHVEPGHAAARRHEPGGEGIRRRAGRRRPRRAGAVEPGRLRARAAAGDHHQSARSGRHRRKPGDRAGDAAGRAPRALVGDVRAPAPARHHGLAQCVPERTGRSVKAFAENGRADRRADRNCRDRLP